MDRGEGCTNSKVVHKKSGIEERNPKFFVFRSLVESEEDQRRLVDEALLCHAQNQGNSHDFRDIQSISTLKTSLKLNLGISCGGDLTSILPKAAYVARRCLEMASTQAADAASTSLKLIANGPLSGLSLLYGLGASMPLHYDSPTKPGQREEWLAMITLGNSVAFRCNSEVLILHSGDALVMDSMAVLHGVDRIVADTSECPICHRIGLPNVQSRLGILFWQGKNTSASFSSTRSEDFVPLDDFHVDSLFGSENFH
jgi:hypothetical protein